MIDLKKMPDKSKRDLLITGVLLTVFAVVFTQNVLMHRKPAPPPAAPAAPADHAIQDMSDQLVLITNIRVYDKLKKERTALWDQEWTRDPFTPPQALATSIKAVNLTLKGILWDENRPKAIVNEKTVLEGDTIYGYTVVEIKQHSVILKTGEKSIELQVFRPVSTEITPPG